eukprot:c5312_g1_i1.p1 GENE.c5312_g1_i1~~c5312_g1_i1.p1  ORF type:complete len:808 (+),score=186.33 c5312_g1_i1:41-2425(+)
MTEPPPVQAQSSVRSFMRRFTKGGLRESPIYSGDYLLRMNNKGKCKPRLFRIDRRSRWLCWNSNVTFASTRHVFLPNVIEIRKGQRTVVFERGLDPTTEHLSFSIIYLRKPNQEARTLDLICENEDQYNRWVTGLHDNISVWLERLSTDQDFNYKYLLWLELTTLENDCIDRNDMIALCQGLNFQCGRSFMFKLFKQFDLSRDGFLNFNEFATMMDSLRSRVEIEEIFDAYAEHWYSQGLPQPVMLPDEFLHFISDHKQEEKPTIELAKSIIDKMRAAIPGSPLENMTYQMFLLYLRQDMNNILKPIELEIHHDMTHPLSDYYIASSHNTYLTGDQLLSASSVSMYIKAFRMGMRSVELDLWDGPDGPIITHGGTATSAISAEAVVKAINDFAFFDESSTESVENHHLFGTRPKHNNFPVILSLENHCSLEQQAKMAEIFTRVLGDRLAMPEDVQSPDGRVKSPWELRGKVLLKGKRRKFQHRNTLTQAPEALDEMFDEEEEDTMPDPQKKVSETRIDQALSDITYLPAIKMKSWDYNWDNDPPGSTSSYANLKLKKFLDKAGKVVRHNMKFLTRVYPSSTRDALLKSSNYDPVPFWALGCQLVALNVQTHDLEFRSNVAMFEMRNGGCGYLLKPAFLREPNPNTGEVFSYHNPQADNRCVPCVLRIEILSAQHLPKPNNEVIDPFVSIEVRGGMPVPKDRYHGRTRTVRHNGFNPVWKELFEFHLLAPELAILYIEVRDEDITTQVTSVAYHAIPVTCMNQGYRHMRLRDMYGQVLKFSSLFVHVTLIHNKNL